MAKAIKIRKGLNIPIKGEAEKILIRAEMANSYAVKPTDFHGITPKLSVILGDSVKAGTPLFFDKNRPEIVFSSPVSGQVLDIVRGERRALQEIVVRPDKEICYEQFETADIKDIDREQIIDKLLKSGVWVHIKQRPFGIVADPKVEPKDIFISCFDTAPLAIDIDFAIQGEEKNFQTGIEALRKLTKGKVHIGINADYPESKLIVRTKNVEKHYFSGPHPAGNVGVQIAQISPINKGDIIWTLNPQDVIIVGRLFNNGIYDASKIVATTGSQVLKPRYYRTILGVEVSQLLQNTVDKSDEEKRYISGNVLTGTKISPEGHLGFFDNTITVIPEGNHYEFMGWMSPGATKYSASRTFLSKLSFGKKYVIDTNYHGEQRAFVVNGQYDKVMPFDIYPVYLMKAIIANDIEKMEQLGIYELIEEDVALCEYVCTSKIEVQELIRKGINSIISEED